MKHAGRAGALRAYLLVASTAAVAIDLVALCAGWLLGVPDSAFQTTPFRIAAAIVIVLSVLVARLRTARPFIRRPATAM